MTRAELEQIPTGTELLRRVRYMPAAELEDISTEELTNAARWLKAAAHSAREGARHLESIITNRKEENSGHTDTRPLDAV